MLIEKEVLYQKVKRYVDDVLTDEQKGHANSVSKLGIILENLVYYAPSVDAVEVVRCGECYKRNTSWCPLADWTLPNADDWCSYGKKKEGEE